MKDLLINMIIELLTALSEEKLKEIYAYISSLL